MKTFNSVFKQVYEEALREYGFRKIKGKYPYYVRLIGDEIVHVITYASRPAMKKGYKGYCIYGGVATVYRHSLNLNMAVHYNFEWLESAQAYYAKNNTYEKIREKSNGWDTFTYKADDETSLIESLEYSLEVTKEIMLPVLDKVTDLKTCVEYYETYNETNLYLFTDKKFGQSYANTWYNEGLLIAKVYSVEEYIESRKNLHGRMLNSIEKFKSIMNNPNEYDRVMKEMERRKEFNTGLLCNYGFEIKGRIMKMKTFNSAFKQVYEGVLSEYGFRKIKGKYPYYVRLIGDEIVHVITYASRPAMKEGYKGYCVYGGVATVYRHSLDLNMAVRYNFEWFKSAQEYYANNNTYEESRKNRNRWNIFTYKSDDETSLIESLEYSLEVTKEIMLPILDKVTDLKTCVEYYETYNESNLCLYTDKNFGQLYANNWYNEGLLNAKVYSVEEYIEKRKKKLAKAIENDIYMIKIGKSGFTEETYEKEKNEMYEWMLERIEKFKSIMNNPNEYDRVMKEMERRKEFNTGLLRNYGFEI